MRHEIYEENELVGVEEIPDVVTVPAVVTMRQARLAMLEAGILDAVTAAVAQAGVDAVIEWEYAADVRRDWPLVQQLSVGLGLTGQQLDDLFSLAATK